MTKYVFLYSGGSMAETEAEQEKFMEDWHKWYTDLGSAVVDPGNPMMFKEGISPNGNKDENQALKIASGYSIINADNIENATSIAKTCPVYLGGSDVSIFETFDM